MAAVGARSGPDRGRGSRLAGPARARDAPAPCGQRRTRADRGVELQAAPDVLDNRARQLVEARKACQPLKARQRENQRRQMGLGFPRPYDLRRKLGCRRRAAHAPTAAAAETGKPSARSRSSQAPTSSTCTTTALRWPPTVTEHRQRAPPRGSDHARALADRGLKTGSTAAFRLPLAVPQEAQQSHADRHRRDRHQPRPRPSSLKDPRTVPATAGSRPGRRSPRPPGAACEGRTCPGCRVPAAVPVG